MKKNFILIVFVVMHVSKMFADGEHFILEENNNLIKGKSTVIRIYRGAETENILDMVSQLRIETFKKYPYLYHPGDNEKLYMQSYTDPQAVVITVTVDGTLAGILAGRPLTTVVEDYFYKCIDAFNYAGFAASDYYYCGDIVVLPQFRKRGIAKKIFSILEKQVREWEYRGICFLTVEREKNHPLRPKNYRDADECWMHLGFNKTEIAVKEVWSILHDDGTVEELEHPSVFWIKDLP